METGLPNPRMNWESQNLPDAWDKFEQHSRLMFEGPLAKTKEKERCAYILLWVGERGRTIHSSWHLDQEEQSNSDRLYKKFKEFVQPKSNPVFARYKFYNERQNGDSIDEYVARLTISAKNCDFGEKTEEMVRDRIVFGCASEKVRERLIEKGKELTLDVAIQIAQSQEYNKKQMSEMASTEMPSADVDFVRRRKVVPTHRGNGRGRARYRVGKDQDQTGRNQQRRLQTPRAHGRTSMCTRCGNSPHRTLSDCPAKGQTCYKCNKLNHFTKMCKTKQDFKNVHFVGDEESGSSEQEFFVYTVSSLSSRPENAVVKLLLGPKNAQINAKIDTGSQVNILPTHLFRQTGLHGPLLPPHAKLTSYTGDQLPVRGKIRMNCAHRSRQTQAEFYIVDLHNAPALINLETASTLGLLKLTYAVNQEISLEKNEILHAFKDVFEGIGTFDGTSTIRLHENATPVVCPVRKVPIALQDKLKTELQTMENQGIISKVTEPTDWVNALVCVEKPNSDKLRICIDPKALNDSIKRPHYPMRDITDITSQLNGAKYFSVLDATKGYYSCKLSEESSLLTTFATMYGRYKYNRLPMGLRSSQDIFNRKMDEILEGLPGVASIVDDVLCWGGSKQEHDKNLGRLLMRAREKGLKFNPDKLVVGQTKVNYFGHVIGENGLSADQDKISAIVRMRTPESRHELEQFLGMVTYLTKFAPNLAETTSPMRELLKKDVQFIWGPEQANSFDRVKQIITQAPVLSYFDPEKPVTLQVDASLKGIGAACLQGGKPIAYASKSLTKSQIDWAQIEKETAAILFGCLKFKHYIYGKKTVVESDCKPVVSIMKKPLCAAPQRLQKLLMQLQPFDIEVIHKKGTSIPIGDALSRNFVSETYPEMFENMDAQVHSVKSLPISDERIEQIRTETLNDIKLQAVKREILNGWPNDRKSCSKLAMEFWNHRDEMSYEDGIIFRGSRIVIPQTLQQDMINAVHLNHLGCQKAVNRARDIMFWPGMTKQITDHVLSCPICEKYRPANPKEPLFPHEIPERPWENVSCDLFMFENKQYMVLVDAFSHHIEIDHLPSTSSITVVRKLKVHFSRFGCPVQIKTDNGAQFVSEEFSKFATEWNFEHVTSSPTMASSNGHAESAVKIAKRILRKAKDANTDPYLALLEFRNTPLPCGYSPAQLLQSRRLRSILPSTNQQLTPALVDSKLARQNMQTLRAKSKVYHDRNAKPLPPLKRGDRIMFQKGEVWQPAKIVNPFNSRSYNIETPDGALYRRNRKFIRKSRTKQMYTRQDKAPCEPHIPVARSRKIPQTNSIKPRQQYFTSKGREVRPPKVYKQNEWVRN